MAVRSTVRRRSARRATSRIVAATLAAAIAATGLAATATAQDRYTDVTSTSHRSHKANIDALDSSGVFDGTECGARKFCPGDPGESLDGGGVDRAGHRRQGSGPGQGVEIRRCGRQRVVDALRRAARRLGDHGRLQGGAASLLPLRDRDPGPHGVVPGAGLPASAGRVGQVHRHAGQHPRGQHRRPVRGGPHRRLQSAPASLLPRQSRHAGPDGHPAEPRPGRIDQRWDRRDDTTDNRNDDDGHDHQRPGAAQRRHADRGRPGGAPVRSGRTRRSPAGGATTATGSI